MRATLTLCIASVVVGSAMAAAPQADHYKTFRMNGQPSNDGSRLETVIFSEDFESGLGDWTTVDVAAVDPTWHSSTFHSYEGNSWWSGVEALHGYASHTLQYLDTPSMDMSALSSPTLTFKLRYATEAPGDEPTGYDCWDSCNMWISVDGGDFVVLENVSPAYGYSSSFAFGNEFGMGTGIPAWAGTIPSFVDASVDLSSYVGHDIVVRWAFCADGSYDTSNNANIWGMIIDDVLITDGADTLLDNDADGTAIPEDFTQASGGSAGDFWELTTEDSHSPNTSAHCPIAAYGMADALVTPVISIPEDMDCWFQFWIYNHMLDADGNDDTYVEDLYRVDLTDDGGLTWDAMFYDYRDAGRPGYTTWEHYLPQTPYNGNIAMSLNAYSGMDVQIRIRVETDYDDDGGIGEGLFIDDFEVIASDVAANDLAMLQVIPAFPRTEGFETEVFLQIGNMGSNDHEQVLSWLFADSELVGPADRVDLPSLTTAGTTARWTPAAAGTDHELKAACDNPEDSIPENDTMYVSPIEVLAPGDYVLSYCYGESANYWEDNPVMFVASESELNMTNVILNSVVVGLYDPDEDTAGVPITLKVYADNEGTPGEVLVNDSFTLNQFGGQAVLLELPVEPAVEIAGDFWVEVVLPDGYPFPLGGPMIWNGGHYAMGDYDLSFSEGIQARELQMFANVEWFDSVEQPVAQPELFSLSPAFPNPFNPTTTLRYAAAAGEQVSLKVFNLQGQEVVTLFEGSATGGEMEAVFDASALASGVYFARLQGEHHTLSQKLVLVK